VIKLIHEHAPDIVLLDIMMGEYSGLELLQDIRRVFYNLPVILCTSHSNFRFDLRSIAADYYVVKSSDTQELRRTIRMALEGNASLPLKDHEDKGKDMMHCVR
jgi:DNA-binding response OmpR family regulator